MTNTPVIDAIPLEDIYAAALAAIAEMKARFGPGSLWAAIYMGSTEANFRLRGWHTPLFGGVTLWVTRYPRPIP